MNIKKLLDSIDHYKKLAEESTTCEASEDYKELVVWLELLTLYHKRISSLKRWLHSEDAETEVLHFGWKAVIRKKLSKIGKVS